MKSIVMMGTPEFAVTSLNRLVEAGIEVKAVITAPDRPAGRGKSLRTSAMANQADVLGIPTLKPTNLKDPDFLEELRSLKADLFVVVAFRMLPEIVWDMPKLGTINLHGSLLPNYRGAAPINRAIMNGETLTGATTFFLQQTIDTGDVIDQVELTIGEDETAGELHDRMKEAGATLLVNSVQRILSGNVIGKPQAEFTLAALQNAPKIHTQDRKIDWGRSAKEVHDHIRGLSPYPAAWTELTTSSKKLMCKVLRTSIANGHTSQPGTVRVAENSMFVACGQGSIEILRIQPEGKKAMDTIDFLRGARLEENAYFE